MIGDSCLKNGVATLNCIFPLFANIILWTLELSGAITIIFIFISGFRFMTSGGDAKKVDQAKKGLTYSVLGLVLIFLSFSIVTLIGQVTGVACIKPASLLSFQSCI